jgi:hypothetical protein
MMLAVGYYLVQYDLHFFNRLRPAGSNVLHHVRIRAQRCKRVQVIRCKPAELEARCLDVVQ